MRRLLLFLSIVAIASAQAPRKPGLYAVFYTSMGEFTAKLYEKETPRTVANFVALATGRQPWLDPQTKTMVRRPLYDNITFHRVIPGTVIQAGDPTGMGNHPCGVRVRDEFLPGLRFDRLGKLAMANTGRPDSAGCQFFITTELMPSWNNAYTIFGEVTEGYPVVAKIAKAPTRDDKPLEPVKLISVAIERVEKAK